MILHSSSCSWSLKITLLVATWPASRCPYNWRVVNQSNHIKKKYFFHIFCMIFHFSFCINLFKLEVCLFGRQNNTTSLSSCCMDNMLESSLILFFLTSSLRLHTRSWYWPSPKVAILDSPNLWSAEQVSMQLVGYCYWFSGSAT